MTKLAKFTKPQREPTPEDIEKVIGKAEARDEPAEDKAESEVRFTLTLPSSLADRVDAARHASGGMARLAWIRLAIAEKLARQGPG
jgi:hypothetical protein